MPLTRVMLSGAAAFFSPTASATFQTVWELLDGRRTFAARDQNAAVTSAAVLSDPGKTRDNATDPITTGSPDEKGHRTVTAPRASSLRFRVPSL